MNASHQVQLLPTRKRNIHTGPGITAGKKGAKRCFYTIKQTHTRSMTGKVHASAYGYKVQSFGLNRSRRLALLTTVIDESAIAAPATTGFSRVPVSGHKIPAAIGMPSEL